MVEKFPKLMTDTESQMQDTYQEIYAQPRDTQAAGGKTEETPRGARIKPPAEGQGPVTATSVQSVAFWREETGTELCVHSNDPFEGEAETKPF